MTKQLDGGGQLDAWWTKASPEERARIVSVLAVSQQAVWTWRKGTRTPGLGKCLAMDLLLGIPAVMWLSDDDRRLVETLRSRAPRQQRAS